VPFDPRVHHRQTVRLAGHDYTQPGAYFVTVCSWDRARVFGEVVAEVMRLSTFGLVVKEEWVRTAAVRPYVCLDAFVVMPDHIHGILVIAHHPAPHAEPPSRARRPCVSGPTGVVRGSLGAVVGQFKGAAAKRINAMRGTPGEPVWQRGFYERVIRSPVSMARIRRYILDNPIRWAMSRRP